MWYVHIIRSKSSPQQNYIGASSDLKQRTADHNAGKSPHTAKFKPRELVWYSAFPDKFRALE
jgi:predicted GIY-YIG superfamily endonuclease